MLLGILFVEFKWYSEYIDKIKWVSVCIILECKRKSGQIIGKGLNGLFIAVHIVKYGFFEDFYIHNCLCCYVNTNLFFQRLLVALRGSPVAKHWPPWPHGLTNGVPPTQEQQNPCTASNAGWFLVGASLGVFASYDPLTSTTHFPVLNAFLDPRVRQEERKGSSTEINPQVVQSHCCWPNSRMNASFKLAFDIWHVLVPPAGTLHSKISPPTGRDGCNINYLLSGFQAGSHHISKKAFNAPTRAECTTSTLYQMHHFFAWYLIKINHQGNP